MNEISKQAQKGQHVALIAAVAVLTMAAVKGLVGSLFNADILVADALNNSADLVAIVASWMGLKFAAKVKSKTFPFGLYKAETIALLLISVIFLCVAWELSMKGLHKILVKVDEVEFSPLPLCIAALSTVSTFFIARYEHKTGFEINSATLLATSKECFLDVATSAAVFFGLLLSYYRVPYIEGAVIIAIGVMLAKLGIQNVISSVMILLDANLDPKLSEKISKDLTKIPGVKGIKEIRIRRSGLTKFIELVISTSGDENVTNANELANEVERNIHEKNSGIDSIMIHVDPVASTELLIALPVEDNKGLESIVSNRFGCAPWFIILRKKDKGFEVVDTFKTNHTGDKKRGLDTSKVLGSKKIDVLITKKAGEGAWYALKDYGISVFHSKGLTVAEDLSHYADNTLKPFDSTCFTTSVNDQPKE